MSPALRSIGGAFSRSELLVSQQPVGAHNVARAGWPPIHEPGGCGRNEVIYGHGKDFDWVSCLPLNNAYGLRASPGAEMVAEAGAELTVVSDSRPGMLTTTRAPATKPASSWPTMWKTASAG